MHVFQQAPQEAFVFHDRVLAAIAGGQVTLHFNGINLLAPLKPEILTKGHIEYRSTVFSGNYVVKLIVTAYRHDPVLHFALLPIIGSMHNSEPELPHDVIEIQVGFLPPIVISGSEVKPAQGQCLNPIRITYDCERMTRSYTAFPNFHSTRHVVASTNRTGVGAYFSIDHHAGDYTLKYWRDQVDACAAQPMHFIKPDGNILTEEDVPNLVFGSAWPNEHSDGFETEYWIKHASEPWRDKGARDQHGSAFSIPDHNHLSFDPLCQAYMAHHDPMHGLMVEFKTETYLLVVPPADNGKGTTSDQPGSGRARARIVKTAMNLWYALMVHASRDGLVVERRRLILQRADRIVKRMASRLTRSIVDLKASIDRGEWIIGGKSGKPPIYSVQEHALFAGTLSMMEKGLKALGLPGPGEISGMRWLISKWVLSMFARYDTDSKEWDTEGDGWAIPYTIDVASGVPSGPTTGGWIFTVEMLAAMPTAPLPKEDREKLASIRQDYLLRPGASDWQTPEFIETALSSVA